MLYGMSLIFGVTGEHDPGRHRRRRRRRPTREPVVTLGIVFVVVGFAFKVSAVPFHTWAPDTYEGAPTPITAFLSVASKAAGFVALAPLCSSASAARSDVWQPLFWVLSAATMTVGNLVALRQTNIVRLFAYSSVAQAGYMLAPLAVAGECVARATRRSAPSSSTSLVYARHEPRRLRRDHRRRPQDPVRRDLQLRRAVPVRPGPHRR